MKPFFSKRMIAAGIGRVRRGAHLLRWLHSGDAPLAANPPAPAASGPSDFESWLLWLQVKRDLIPPDLRPAEGDEPRDARLLAKLCSGLRGPAPSKSWLVDCVRVPVSLMARDVGARHPHQAVLEELMSARATMLECCLWSLGWWGAYLNAASRDAGLVDALWRVSGEALIDRLTIDEAWLARKRLLERMN